jgi:hypothetical protein
MMDSVPTTEFGDTARSMRSRKTAVADWIKANEQKKPNLVRAGKVIIYKLLSHVPLNAPCLPLDRCIELSPSYIAKVAETSPQTARNAWLELRVLLGWRELSARAKIGKTLERIGYEPRWPSGGRRWGTHVFLFSKLYSAIQSISEWLQRSGRYIGISCVPENQKIESSIVRIVNDKLNNPNVDLDKNSSPCSPPRSKRKPRDETNRSPWRRKGWAAKGRKEQMGELFSFMIKMDEKKSSPDARRRRSWLDRMSKIPPRFRYGLYRPGESIKSPSGQLAMCLIAEVNAAYGRVLQIDVADSEDEWFGYNLINPNMVEKHTGGHCSLSGDLDMCGEELSHATPTTGHSGRHKAGRTPKRLDSTTSLLWSKSEKSIWPKYEILADHASEHGSWEMLNIIWPDGPRSSGDVSEHFG